MSDNSSQLPMTTGTMTGSTSTSTATSLATSIQVPVTTTAVRSSESSPQPGPSVASAVAGPNPAAIISLVTGIEQLQIAPGPNPPVLAVNMRLQTDPVPRPPEPQATCIIEDIHKVLKRIVSGFETQRLVVSRVNPRHIFVRRPLRSSQRKYMAWMTAVGYFSLTSNDMLKPDVLRELTVLYQQLYDIERYIDQGKMGRVYGEFRSLKGRVDLLKNSYNTQAKVRR